MDEKLKALAVAGWTKIKALVAAFWVKLNADLSKLWAEDKFFLIVFGAIVLTLKFRTLLIDLIINNAKSIFTKAQNQSNALDAKEKNEGVAADTLIEQAEQLPNSEKPVNADWYNNEK